MESIIHAVTQIIKRYNLEKYVPTKQSILMYKVAIRDLYTF